MHAQTPFVEDTAECNVKGSGGGKGDGEGVAVTVVTHGCVHSGVCVYFRSLRVRVCVCAKPFANSVAIRVSQPIAGEEGTFAGPGAVMTASAAVIPSHFARRSTPAPPPPLWLLPTKEVDEGCTQETKERCCARGCSRPLGPPPRGAVSVVSLLRLTIP